MNAFYFYYYYYFIFFFAEAVLQIFKFQGITIKEIETPIKRWMAQA